ncbi:unnamed protein product [Blepharisma stoltei]|uniref:Uncharacterized protein n=1 Tax=Blepharisma stoltei TaxID=1481888 RepID=A0AAU9K0D4_9CILI|nr:unnamed protein product [Blepharisma stoltei]
MAWIFLLFFLHLGVNAISSVSSIFPPQYSHYLNEYTEIDIKLTEAILSGEEIQPSFGISFWVKIYDITRDRFIFLIDQSKSKYKSNWKAQTYLSLRNSYILASSSFYFVLEWEQENADLSSILKLSYTPSDNWIFIGISASTENKSCLFYYNNLGTESYISEDFDIEISIPVNSHLQFLKIYNLKERISDFRIHNNIYNEVYDWRLQYSSSCAGVSCASLFPSIDYGKCGQWCASQTEWFFPLFEPKLYANAPYLSSNDLPYYFDRQSLLHNDVSVPTNGWSDYSITGWFQFYICKESTFFQIQNSSKIYLQVNLATSTSDCDMMKAKIYSTDGTNIAYDSTAINGTNYIGNWIFFAITINSSLKLLKIYTQSSPNPPSTTYPLVSSSITYTYTVRAFTSDKDIFFGEYLGNYADFRFYPGNSIDATLIEYNNNIYSAATYLDPYCTSWSSIWYCSACEIGYYVKNGICKKCHPSCVACSSDDTETNCLGCASGYYAQPNHPSTCFDYCPLGFTSDSALNQCTGTQGYIANINFDNNLLLDYNASTLKLIDSFKPDNQNYHSLFPANKRGVYIGALWADQFVLEESTQNRKILGSDFTIEFWVMLFKSDSQSFFSTQIDRSGEVYINFCKYYEKNLSINILTRESSKIEAILYENESKNKEWAFYSASVSFDDSYKHTQVTLVWNEKYEVKIAPSYYKEASGIQYLLGSGLNGFLYSFALYNYGKNYNEILLSLGTCSSCSACPGILNYCLPTCDKTEYVDNDGNCQKCPSSCHGICSRASSCNLCYDDLCYKCTKYEIGACIQCVENATLKNGQCGCQNGYKRQGVQCLKACNDGYYFDLITKECLSCPINCLKCGNGNTCIVCKSELNLLNGKCMCADGYFSDSSNKCLKCDISCSNCSIISSNCTSCISDLPILYDSNKCYPCNSFEGYSIDFAISISYFTDDLRSQLSSNCIEICGDGKNMGQAQCDDGNNANWDGCSSSCKIETGWSCFGGNANSPDVCKDTTPPYPIFAYLSKNDSGYRLTLSFNELVTFGIEISKNIEIEIENLKFDWSITKENSTYIIDLDIHEDASAGTVVKLEFINPNLIIDMNGNEMQEKSVSTKLMVSYSYTTGQVISSSVTTAVTTTISISLVVSILSAFSIGFVDLQLTWWMIETMQIQNYLIYLSPKYPENFLSYLKALGMANGRFLPNPFKRYLVKTDPFPDPPQNFVDENLDTDFLMNYGQFLLVWTAILIGLLISLILFKLRPSVSIIRSLKSLFLFSILLRIGIESFLETTLSTFLQLREFSLPSQHIGYLSLALSIPAAIYLLLFFVLIICQITLKSSETLNKTPHERRYGVLYAGFKRNSKFAASFLLFQNIRRVILVSLCVFLYDHVILQVAFLVISSFIYTALLILLRPYEKSVLGNSLIIVCEIFYFSSNCLILKLLDDDLSDDNRTNIGWGLISLLSFSLLLHIISILIKLVQEIKKLYDWFLKSFANKFVIRKRRVILNEITSHKPNQEWNQIMEDKSLKIHGLDHDSTVAQCQEQRSIQ